MSSILLLWSFLLFSAETFAVAVHTRRQIPPELLSPDGLMPLAPYIFGSEEPVRVKSDKTLDLPPQIRKDAKRKLVRFGPFEVLGIAKPDEDREWIAGSVQSMDPVGVVLTAGLTDSFCHDCTVLAGRTDLAYENGTRADVSNGIYMHHVLTVDRSKPPPTFVNFCPERPEEKDADYAIISLLSPYGMLFLGGGNDGSNVRYSTQDSRVESGYYIKNNTFAMTADLVNYTQDTKTIYVTYDIEYLPGKIGKDAASTLLSVTGCASPGFMDESPISNLTSSDFVIREDGWIVNARGHLHDGGEAMQLFLNGRLVCNSTATYGGKGGTAMTNGTAWQTISSMSDCQEPLKIKKGDRMSMKSLYNTIHHPLRESDGRKMEEMGMFSIAFVPST